LKKCKMKKINIGILMIIAFILWKCNDKFEVIIDQRIHEVGAVLVKHVNPATGQEYTAEELSELDYNPGQMEYYLKEQPVELSIWSEAKPLKVEIKDVGAATPIVSLDNPVEENDGFAVQWSTTIEELGIEEGRSRRLNIVTIYDDKGVGGFDYSTEKTISFIINHKSPKILGPLVSLREGFNSLTALSVEALFTDQIEAEGIGTYVELNGSDSRVIVPDDDLDFIHSDDFSVSFWVNTTATNSDPSIIGDKDWGSGGNKGFVVAFKGEIWGVNIGDGNGNRVDANGAAINDGAWHHLAITFNRAGNMSLYQDGELLVEKDMTAIGDMNSGFPVQIGQDGTGSYGHWFKGNVGSVEISNYVLSAGEVKLSAGQGTGVQYRSLSSVDVLDVDNGAASNTVVKGMPVGVYTGGEYSTIVDNDGLLNFRHDQDFSLAVWVNTTATNSDPSIIGDKDWGSGGNKGFVVAFTGEKWKINIADGNGNRRDADGNAINDGEWHLLMVTFDRDGEMIAYQDGVPVSAVDMSAVGDMNSGLPIRIAQDGTGSYGHFFEGKVGRSILFDYVVSPEQALDLFEEL
jgi:hypothetical protein